MQPETTNITKNNIPIDFITVPASSIFEAMINDPIMSAINENKLIISPMKYFDIIFKKRFR